MAGQRGGCRFHRFLCGGRQRYGLQDMAVALQQLERVKRQILTAELGFFQRAGDLADGRADPVQVGGLMRGLLHAPGNDAEQFVHIFALARRNGYHTHAKCLGQGFAVDFNALCAAVVNEIQRNHHRQAERNQLHG